MFIILEVMRNDIEKRIDVYKRQVKRPMRFEMKKDENLATLIKYAGGFEADAYTRSLRVVRQNGEEYLSLIHI